MTQVVALFSFLAQPRLSTSCLVFSIFSSTSFSVVDLVGFSPSRAAEFVVAVAVLLLDRLVAGESAYGSWNGDH